MRPFNVYGPGDCPGPKPGDSHVIPDLTAKILTGQDPLEIFGDGEQTRCFTHVRDIARGIALAVRAETAINEDFNLGDPFEISVKRLAEMLWKICGRQGNVRFKTVAQYEIDVKRRAVNPQKAKSLLGWVPEVSLEEGLREFVLWAQKHVLQTVRG